MNYWWSEGFTDYYSRVLSFRSGGLSLEEFISEFNDMLRNYYLSHVVNEPNSRIKKDFWNDYNIQKLPYYRGFVFAFYLNDLIKKSIPDKSLDNVMTDLFSQANGKDFSTKLFENITKKYIPVGIKKEISQFIKQGKTIELKEAASALPLVKVKIGKYECGFDWNTFVEKGIIKNINPTSNAYKAGLREKDDIIAGSFPKGHDPYQIATIKTTGKTFKFRPESVDKVDIYQFKENLSSEEKEQIRRFFGVR